MKGEKWEMEEELIPSLDSFTKREKERDRDRERRASM